jgi:tRNA(Ile2) C34 agmatinyltransferase TiaS
MPVLNSSWPAASSPRKFTGCWTIRYRHGSGRGGRVALALVGAPMTPTTHASIAERDDIEVGLNRRVATRPAASPAS